MSSITIPGLTAPQAAALEALFVQDLPGGGLAHIAPKAARALIEKGLAEQAWIPIGKGRCFMQYRLTLAGHKAYREACRDVEIVGDAP